jgi:hexosaminidase
MVTKSVLPLILFAAVPAAPATPHDLLPVPTRVELTGGRLPITHTFTASAAGCRDVRAEAALRRALRRLQGRTGLVFAPTAADPDSASLVVECERAGTPWPSLSDDETYALEVSAERARLRAREAVGVLRGLETVLQLVQGDRDGYFIPAARIKDAPRFRWRGLLIDVCRHWMPIEVIKRNLDGMAAVKLNVLHLHLTEDQGFRVESKRHPKLHGLGSDGLYYTQDQIREIVAYAAARGIRVVPEFDMPGHVTSWLVGHPELAAAPGPYAIARTWGVFDAALDPSREAVYRFLDGFLSEMASLFPDEYVHIGGDENNGKQWSANPAIQAFARKNNLADAHALQAYFNRRVSAILRKRGKKMIGWDEVLHPDLPKDIVVQSWRGQAALADGAKAGYAGILSNGYYLDLMQPAAQHYAVDPIAAGSSLDESARARILGGEACMWAEFVGPETVDSRIWPRLGAIAERLWSAASVIQVDDLYRRLATLSLRLEELGLEHERNVDVLLRRLAGRKDIDPLRTMVGVVEPVKEYRRSKLRPATQMMPLTRFVDAASADSLMARRITALVDALAGDAPAYRAGRAELAEVFRQWRGIRPDVDVLIERAPALAEVKPLAVALAVAGQTGLEALSYLEAGVAQGDDWRASQIAALDQASQPVGEVELAIVPALKRLVELVPLR